MELGTFGAILGFALELEGRAAEFYRTAARGELTGLFNDLAKASDKRVKRLERARRELVSEMILESITGLHSEAFAVELDPETKEAELRRQGRNLEQTIIQFYQDAAAKMPIREVVRLFKRLVREHERQLERL
jgi:rubrerythrin